jgi:hypothetical protein
MAMGFRSLFNGDWVAAQSFQPTGDGWLFRAPSLAAPFGGGRNYILNDAQKEQATATLKRLWGWTMVEILVVVMPAVVIFTGKTGDYLLGNSWNKLAVGVIGTIVLSVLAVALQKRALRPVLAQARPTQGSITMGERVRRQASTMSLGALALMTVMMLLLTGSGVVALVNAADLGARIGWALCTMILGLLSAFQIALVISKSRPPHRS